MNKRWSLSIVAALLAASTTSADAGAGDWLGRVRLLSINPDVDSSLPGLDVSSEVAPEVDVSYFLTNHLALELVATDSKFNVSLNVAPLGSVNVLPPTLLLQYHFTPGQPFSPYVGAGINYTRFHDVNLASPLSLDKESWGAALQVGFDVALNERFSFNLDLKKVFIKTDVNSAGAPLTDLKIDPWIIGAGVGMKF